MANSTERTKGQLQNWGNLLLGAWFFISPWALHFTLNHRAAMNAHVLGAIILLLGAAALVSFRKWEEWLNMLLGAWLIISPWALGFHATTAAMWNGVAVGAAVLLLSLWANMTVQESPPTTV